MRRELLIGLYCLSLTGCDKLQPFLFRSISTNPQTILIAGQSNASRFAWWGTKPLFSKIPNLSVTDCSVGSTTVDEWAVGGHYFNSCLEKLHGQIPDLIFWWQGENNTYAGMGTGFKDKTEAILNGFRRLNPNMKVFYAQLGQNNSGHVYPDWPIVQQAQADIWVKNGKMIYTADLATNTTDGVHMLPESEVTVGERIALEL